MNALPVRSVFCFVLASSLSGIALPQERSPAGGERPLLAQAPSAMPSPSVEIRIGHVGPLSGNLSRLGRDAENGVRLALEQANAAGIRIGGKAATFVLVSQDDQANSQFAVAAAQKLVAANVAGVIGHLNSGAAVAASPTYRQAGVPVISASATTPHLTELGSRVQFRVASRDDGEGGAMANYLVSTVRPKVVAIIDDSTAYGELLADEVEASLRSNGIDVLARRKGTDKTSDWRAVLAAMQGRPPDTIVYGGMDDTGGPLVKQARELGIEARFFFGDGACRAEMSQLAGKASEGMLCVQPGIPAASAAKTFIDAYKARFNVAPIAYAPFAYDAANMLIDAMKAANSADPTKYMVELTRLSHAGATGRIAFNEKGDRKLAPFTVYAMRGGALEPIAIVPGREPATGRPGAIVEGGGAIAGERQGGGIGQEAIATSCDSGSASRSARFATKDGVATDRKTGLTWQRCSVGQRWSPGAGCAGNPKAFEWNEIGEQAANGWRVPTQRELIEIQAKGCSGAAIDAAVFPNAPAEMFWSTTVYPDGNPGFAFFGKEGGGGSAPEDLGMYLRLVRDK